MKERGTQKFYLSNREGKKPRSTELHGRQISSSSPGTTSMRKPAASPRLRPPPSLCPRRGCPRPPCARRLASPPRPWRLPRLSSWAAARRSASTLSECRARADLTAACQRMRAKSRAPSWTLADAPASGLSWIRWRRSPSRYNARVRSSPDQVYRRSDGGPDGACPRGARFVGDRCSRSPSAGSRELGRGERERERDAYLGSNSTAMQIAS